MTIRIDFHVHTKYSPDSIIEPRRLAEKSCRLGIIPAVTDHYSIEAHEAVRKTGMEFIPGEEIFTDRGDLIGLFVNELIPKGTPFLEATDRVHEQGGITYLPHMYDYGRSGKHASDTEAAKADIIEVFNARCMRKDFNQRAEAFARKHRKPMAAGSDSHFLFEFGKTYTELPDFDLDRDNPKSLLRALAKAKLVTRKGPIYARGVTKLISIAKKTAWRLRSTPPVR